MARGDRAPHGLAKITAGVVLDGARVDAEVGLAEHFTRIRDGIDSKLPGSFGRSLAFMTEERAEAFSEKLRKLLEDEFDANDQDTGSPFGFTFAFFKLAGTGESDR